MACWNGHIDVARALIKEFGVAMNANDFTLVHLASMNGHMATVRVLVSEFGMDVKTKPSNGFTPLVHIHEENLQSKYCALGDSCCYGLRFGPSNACLGVSAAEPSDDVSGVHSFIECLYYNTVQDAVDEDGKGSVAGHAAICFLVLAV